MHPQSLLIDVAIILAAAFPILFISRKLRLPEVFSFLLTGIVIGPHAIGLVRDTRQVEAIAELGVALILFFIGLHVPLRRLRALGRTTLMSGSIQMALTGLLITLIGLPLGIPVRLAIFFGLLLSLSSTAVVLPLLAAREEVSAPFARKFLGVSIFQDFAVIPLMLLVPAFGPAMAGAPSLGAVLARVGVAIAGVVTLIVVARVAVPRLFREIAKLGSRESFTAAAVVLIVATIALAERVGISAALGAFAAGVVVGDTDYIHEISGILRPFRDFLSVLFFASVGMLCDPRFILGHPLLVAATVTIVVTIKVLAAYPALRASSAIRRTSIRAAFALAPVGEFSFLLVQAGKRAGIVSPQHEQLFVAVAVITLASAPLLVELGKRLAEEVRGHQEPIEESEALSGHIIIIGYGLNGQNVARVLKETGIRHVVLDEDPDRVAAGRRAGSQVLVADAGDADTLLHAGIMRALAVVIAISDPDGTRRIVQISRTLSSEVHLLVRTRYVSEVERLRELGASEVIPEEFETSIEIVTRLLRILCVPGNVIASQLRLLRDEGYRLLRDPAARVAGGRRLSALLAAGTSQIYLVMPESPADGRTLEELQLDDESVTVPAILRDGKPLSPAPRDLPLQGGDSMLLVGAHDDLMRVITRLEGGGSGVW